MLWVLTGWSSRTLMMFCRQGFERAKGQPKCVAVDACKRRCETGGANRSFLSRVWIRLSLRTLLTEYGLRGKVNKLYFLIVRCQFQKFRSPCRMSDEHPNMHSESMTRVRDLSPRTGLPSKCGSLLSRILSTKIKLTSQWPTRRWVCTGLILNGIVHISGECPGVFYEEMSCPSMQYGYVGKCEATHLE